MSSKLALLLLVITLPACSKQPPQQVDTVEYIQRGVVPVICAQAGNSNNIASAQIVGSGFFINRSGYFVTASHVLLELDTAIKQTHCIGAIYVPKTSWKERTANAQLKFFTFTDCRYKADVDVGACVPSTNPFADAEVKDRIQTLALGSLADHPDGSPVAFTGFPLGIVFPVTSKGEIAAFIPDENLLLIDKSAWPGASGSPVYDPQGKVLGLLFKRGTNESEGIAAAVPVESVLTFLHENNITAER
jgi:S1-C subfamily serine protease